MGKHMQKQKGKENEMTHDEAQRQLRTALRTQKTISIPKLKRILESMNISLRKNNRDREIEYLKKEIRKMRDKYESQKVV